MKLIKKRLFFMLAFCFCVSFFACEQTAKADDKKVPLIQGIAGMAKAGESVTMTVSLENNPGITVMVLNLDYDKDALTLENVQDESLLKGASFVTSPSYASHPYRVIWMIGTSNVAKDGKLLTLTFHVNDNAQPGNYEIAISYEKDDIYDASLKNVEFQINNAVINVTRQTGNNHAVAGDANADGKVDLEDAQAVLKAALGITTHSGAQKKMMDVDANGTIDLEDAQAVLKAALGIMKL